MLASAATPIGTTGASEPPVRTTSHSPVRISRSASWKAMTDVAQAATWVMTGPVRPYSIDSRAAPIEPDSAGIANAADEARALRVVDVGPVDDRLDPAAAGVDDDADPVALLLGHRREVDPRVGDRLLAGGHREVDEAGHPAGHLRVHRGRRVEVEDLGRDLDLEARRVEALDAPRPGDAGDEVRPVRRKVVADRHDRAEAGDDGATRTQQDPSVQRKASLPRGGSGLRGEHCSARTSGVARQPCQSPSYRLKMTAPLWPPRPMLFDSA